MLSVVNKLVIYRYDFQRLPGVIPPILVCNDMVNYRIPTVLYRLRQAVSYDVSRVMFTDS